MTPTRFSQIGTMLYGSAWRDPLARALKVSERTVRRWADGDSPIPEGIAVDLAALCRKKSDCLARTATALNGER